MRQPPDLAGGPAPEPTLAEVPLRSDLPLRPESEQLAFYDATMRRCQTAEARTGRVVRHIELAGTRIALLFAGERLVPVLFPALAHLEVEADRDADVSFHVWDTESTGVDVPPPPCRRECFTDRGDIWSFGSRRIRSAFHWIEFSLNLLDLERREGVFWVRSSEQVPYWTKASPLRTLLHWWMEANGAQMLHAAAVGTDEGALLVTGKGGVGKSTTALTCLTAGMAYIADDYVVVRLEPEPTVFSVYSTAKLDRPQLDRFPQLAPHAANLTGADDKVVVHLEPAFARQLRRSLPLLCVASPTFAGVPETFFASAPPGRLQRAAAFTTMSQLPHAGRTTHEFIERMVAALPGVELHLGTNLGAIPWAIQECLRDPPRAAPGQASSEPRAARPLVSVVIPVYNGAAFLVDALRNVLSQDYPALELIVVDDGSTEDIEGALRAVPADVRFFRQDNAGAASARNRGIRDASGELFAFLDVDDLWPAGTLSALVERMQAHAEADVVRGRAQVTRYAGPGVPGEYLGSPAEAFPYYIGAGLYRRRAFETVGLFDPDLRFGEDTDWYTRAGERGVCIERLDEVTLFVRRHEGNLTRGKTLAELNPLRLFKKALDRQRREHRTVQERERGFVQDLNAEGTDNTENADNCKG
jgi:hypothetical protein